MERGYHVIGEGITIGRLERLSGDRSCRWDPGTGTEEQAGVFASMLPEAAAPATLPRVVLFEVRDGHKPYCLAAVLADGVLGLRQLTAALSDFFRTDNTGGVMEIRNTCGPLRCGFPKQKPCHHG